MKKIIENVVTNHGYLIGSSVKGDVRFLTDKIMDIVSRKGTGNWKDKESFLFEIKYRNDFVTFKAVISPGNNHNRMIFCVVAKNIGGYKEAKGDKWLVHHMNNVKGDLIGDKSFTNERIEQLITDLLNKNKRTIELYEKGIIEQKYLFQN